MSQFWLFKNYKLSHKKEAYIVGLDYVLHQLEGYAKSERITGYRSAEEIRASLDITTHGSIARRENETSRKVDLLLEDIKRSEETLITSYAEDKISDSEIEKTTEELERLRDYASYENIIPLEMLEDTLKTLNALLSTVDKGPAVDIITKRIRLPMKPKTPEIIERGQQQLIPPYVQLHQQIAKAGAYQLLNPERARLLQTYLTTELTFSDMQRQEGFKSATGVADNVKKSLEMIFPHLPQEVQEEYKSAKDAIKTKSGQHTESSIRRMRDGWNKLRQQAQESGARVKAEFSDTHRQHIGQANERRWEREREARRAAQTEDQEKE